MIETSQAWELMRYHSGMNPLDHPLHSRYATFARSASGITVTFEPLTDLTLGSIRREMEATRRVVRLVRRIRPLQLLDSDTKACAILALENADLLPKLLFDIDKALDAFKQEGLHPREVEEILGITSRERIRWTKDGRLPRSGTGAFGRGRQSVQFALYPLKKIAALTSERQIIQAWREADAAATGQGKSSMP